MPLIWITFTKKVTILHLILLNYGQITGGVSTQEGEGKGGIIGWEKEYLQR